MKGKPAAGQEEIREVRLTCIGAAGCARDGFGVVADVGGRRATLVAKRTASGRHRYDRTPSVLLPHPTLLFLIGSLKI